MPAFRNILGVVVMTAVAMAIINRIAVTRRLVATDPR